MIDALLKKIKIIHTGQLFEELVIQNSTHWEVSSQETKLY